MHIFSLHHHSTSFRKELVAGGSMFVAMSYILVINPILLGEIGMDRNGVYIATILATVLTTLISAVYTKVPLVLAPGIGLSTLFCSLEAGIFSKDITMTLLIIYLSGILLLILVRAGLFDFIYQRVPDYISHSLVAGMGVAVLWMSVKKYWLAEHVVTSVSQITLSGCCILFFGIIYVWRKKREGGLLLACLITYLAGLQVDVFRFIWGNEGSILEFFQQYFDFSFRISDFGKVAFQFPAVSSLVSDAKGVVAVLIGVVWVTATQLCYTMGTAVSALSIVQRSDANYDDSAVRKLVVMSGIGNIAGGCLGAAPISACPESIVGIRQGARTGFSAMIAVFFCIGAVLFAPIVLSMGNYLAAPIMLYAGATMLRQVREINWRDGRIAVASVLLILIAGTTQQIVLAVGVALLADWILSYLIGDSASSFPR